MANTLSDNLAKKELAEAIVKNPKILYEQVLGQGIHTGTITFDRLLPEDEAGIITVPFILSDDFSFSLSNSWGELVDGNIQLLDTAIKWINGLTSLSNNSYDVEISYKNKVMGRVTYKGSDTPKFNVNLMFVCTQRSIDPSEIMKNIAAMCLPTEMTTDTFKKSTIGSIITGTTEGVKEIAGNVSNSVKNNMDEDTKQNLASIYNNLEDGIIKTGDYVSSGISSLVKNTNLENNGIVKAAEEGFSVASKALAKAWDITKSQGFLYAPLGYKTGWDEDNHQLTSQGTISLQIGKWFKADKLVCESIGNIKFSKETIAPPPEWLNQHSSSSIYTTTKDSDKWGFPLYATCSLTLRPITYITYKDFMNYFILPNSIATKINPSTIIGDIQNAGSELIRQTIKDNTNVNGF